jgi:hypothetical protein
LLTFVNPWQTINDGNLDFGAVADSVDSVAGVERSGELPIFWQDTWYVGNVGDRQAGRVCSATPAIVGGSSERKAPADETTSQ